MSEKKDDRYNFDYFDKMNQKDAAQAPKKKKGKKPAGDQTSVPKSQKPPRIAPDQQPKPNEMKQLPGDQPKKSGGKQKALRKTKAPAPTHHPNGIPIPKNADPLPKKSKREYANPEERKKVMRRRKILAGMGGTFAVIIAGAILCMTVLFKIDTIEVIGASRYSAEQIIEASELGNGQNLFTFNEGAAVDNIVTTLPYINTVSISRHLPGKVVMEVSDVTVVGAVQVNSNYVVIGTNGKMLELVDKLPENCPLLVGAELTKMELGENIEYANEQQKEALDAFAKALEDGEIDKITKIDIRDLYNVKATYDGRIDMEFGMSSDMDFKIRFARAVLDSGKITKNQKGSLDLSLAAEQNKVYFDPDYTVATKEEEKKDDTSSKTEDGDDTSSQDSNVNTDYGSDSDSGNDSNDGTPDWLPEDYSLSDDGYYYGADGYYSPDGDFYYY